MASQLHFKNKEAEIYLDHSLVVGVIFEQSAASVYIKGREKPFYTTDAAGMAELRKYVANGTADSRPLQQRLELTPAPEPAPARRDLSAYPKTLSPEALETAARRINMPKSISITKGHLRNSLHAFAALGGAAHIDAVAQLVYHNMEARREIDQKTERRITTAIKRSAANYDGGSLLTDLGHGVYELTDAGRDYVAKTATLATLGSGSSGKRKKQTA